MDRKTAIVIGAGPAGLTAAHELLQQTDIHPVVLEQANQVGGISRTVLFKGNRLDIGGHRFFSKHPEIIEWWRRMLPLQEQPEPPDPGQPRKRQAMPAAAAAAELQETEAVMLLRKRLSRILFLGTLFDYPISLHWGTIKGLGCRRTARILTSYVAARAAPRKPETSLEDFYINRFGTELYHLFFRDYTAKVWGVPCSRISADWGAERVRGLSIGKALAHALRRPRRQAPAIHQPQTERSLIEYFLYPKLGPGQLWDEVARRIQQQGGDLLPRHRVIGLRRDDHAVRSVTAQNADTGDVTEFPCDYVLSSIPVGELMAAITPPVPDDVRRVADGLPYRDFLIVGLLVRRMAMADSDRPLTPPRLPDNWIYIQEREVRIGRLQIFNNWSPALVRDPDTVWLGLEYFCTAGDDLWGLPDDRVVSFAVSELTRIGMIDPKAVLDATVVRAPKAYPAYFGTYDRFSVVRAFVDSLDNLFLIGRNGMHRYGNMDHAMLSAMAAVRNIGSR